MITASPDPDMRFVFSTIVAIGLMGGTMESHAQIQLIPDAEDTESQTQTGTPTQNTIPQDGSDTGIQPLNGLAIEELGSVDAEAVGALQDPSAALPATLWSPLSRRDIAALIEGLPSHSGFPAAQDLVRRLLLSPAALPPAEQAQPLSILQSRLHALIRLGLREEAAFLASVGEGALLDTASQVSLAEVYLADFNVQEACKVTSKNTSHTPFWAKLLAFCQAVQGQREQASLAAQILFDTGIQDPIYFSLIDHITLDLPPEIKGEASGALHYAMLRYANVTHVAESPDPLIQRLSLTRSGDLPRIEDATRLGLLPAKVLADAYQSEKFKDNALQTALETSQSVTSDVARALLYQAVQHYEDPSLKAKTVAMALQQAQRDGLYLATAPLFAQEIASLSPTEELLWFAEEAARLFYVSDNIPRARAWHSLLRNAVDNTGKALESDARLWHLALLSGEKGPALAASSKHWERAITANIEKAEEARRYIHELLALSSAAVGENIVSMNADQRRQAMQASAEHTIEASPLTLLHLKSAARKGHVGEVISISLAALSSAAPQELSTSTFVSVLHALHSVGLQREARRIAMEAAVLRKPELKNE